MGSQQGCNVRIDPVEFWNKGLFFEKMHFFVSPEPWKSSKRVKNRDFKAEKKSKKFAKMFFRKVTPYSSQSV